MHYIAPRVASDPEYHDAASIVLDMMVALMNPDISLDPLGDE